MKYYEVILPGLIGFVMLWCGYAAWVFDTPKVYDKAKVYDKVEVYGNTQVCDEITTNPEAKHGKNKHE